MQVNTEVYGAASTWRKDTDGWVVNSSVPYDYQFKLGQYDSLADYNTNSKIPIGTEIDKSICYAAHAEGMPLAKQSGFYIDEVSGAYVIKRFVRDKQTGFFFGHYTNSWLYNYDALQGAKAILNNITASLADLKNQYWIPEGVMASYPDQPSARVRPIVEFNTKGVYLAIMVRVWNTANGTVQDYPLNSLYSGDWSAYRILQAWAEPWVYNTSDSSYTRATASSSNTCSVCPADLFKWKEYEGTTESVEYITYAPYFRQSRLPLYGWVHESVDTRYYRPLSMYRPLVRCLYNRDPAQSVGHIFIETIPTIFNSYDYTDWGAAIEGYAAINADNLEGLRKACAAYCLFFTEKAGNTLSSNADRWISTDMFCGVMDENGVGHGEYTRGSGNLDNSVYGMGSSQNSPYSPGGGGGDDPNTYSSQTYFNPVLGINSMTKRYVLDGAAVEQLGRDLWQISDDLANIDPAETFKNYEDLIIDNFLTNDPISCIVGLNKYPINNIPTGTQAEPVKYGKIQGAAQGKPLETCSMFFNFSGVRIYPKFGRSFLDYEPYTHYELYIPFCGTVQIDPGDIIDHILSVQMCIDFATGTATAYVMADNLCINTVSGSCAINIPVTGTDGVTLNAQINNGIINTKKAQGNLFLGGFLNTFTVGGLLKTAGDPSRKANDIMQGALDKAQAIYDLEHTQVPMHTIGSASPVGSWTLELDCRLMIYYPEGDAIDSSGGVSASSPKLADLTEYGHTTGFSCIMQGSVSEFSGYTVGNIDTSSIAGATSEEREQIRSAFAHGVWLPMPEE